MLSERDFSFYSTRHGRWIAESGDFQLLVGASSRDIRLQQGVTLQSTEKLNYRFSEYSFFREFWSNPELKPLLIELMPKWLGSQAGEGKLAGRGCDSGLSPGPADDQVPVLHHG